MLLETSRGTNLNLRKYKIHDTPVGAIPSRPWRSGKAMSLSFAINPLHASTEGVVVAEMEIVYWGCGLPRLLYYPIYYITL